MLLLFLALLVALIANTISISLEFNVWNCLNYYDYQLTLTCGWFTILWRVCTTT